MKRAYLAVSLLVLLSSLGLAQQAEITLWPVPTPDSLPVDLSFSTDGMVYFTEFSGEKIGKLNPAGNTIAERDVGASPAGIWVEGQEMIYFTVPLEDALRAVVFTSGGAGWNLPTSGGWPAKLVPAPSGPGVVNLWLNQRTGGKVVRFSPSQVAVTLPLFTFPDQPVSPAVFPVDPVMNTVAPEVHPGNPMLPPPIALLTRTTSGPFTEWSALYPGTYVEDVALAPDGRVWFSQRGDAIGNLDPASDTALFYGVPPGAIVVGLDVDAQGRVWFTDITRPAIGVLDPTSGDYTLWTIPGGVQPIEIVADMPHGVWFADREGDAIGFLSPDRDEFAIYRLPPGSYPVTVKLGPDGAVWFVCERGNAIGRLEIVPVLGPPPLPPSQGQGCGFPAYSVFQSGNVAEVRLACVYDGAAGLPAYVEAVPTVQGTPASPFHSTRETISTPGRHDFTFSISYLGSGRFETDGLLFRIYTDAGTVCERRVDFHAVWTQ